MASPNLIDYGVGKLGVGKTEDGQDIAIDESQDKANWGKMSFGQKIGSGFARGLESVGSVIGFGNIARQAQASRIEDETKMTSGDALSVPTTLETKQTSDGPKLISAPESSRSVETLKGGSAYEDYQQQLVNPQDIAPAQDVAGKVYQDSDELKNAEKQSARQPTNNIVSAPTTNVNQTTQNITRIPARNTESTYREYARSRFGF